MLTLSLAVQPFWAFGYDWVGGGTNPIGEKLYRKELVIQLLPGAVVAMMLLLVWLAHVARLKAREDAPENANSYDI
jgi:hypothetical protein